MHTALKFRSIDINTHSDIKTRYLFLQTSYFMKNWKFKFIAALCLSILQVKIAYTQQVNFTLDTFIIKSIAELNYSYCAMDMNGDFLDDIVRVSESGIYIDYQQTNGQYEHIKYPLIVQAVPDWSICGGDIDNNGFNDLLFGNTFAVSIVMRADTGNDYIESVIPTPIFSQRTTMFDINNDGWLDAFVCHDAGQSLPLRNNGEGVLLADYSILPTANLPGNYSAIWTDYDNDGDGDLYISKCDPFAPPGNINRTNLLYRNNNDGTFSELGAVAGIDDNAQSWSTAFEDFDNDGDMDAFVVNHDSRNRFYLNSGDGTFVDIIDQTGIDPNDLGAFDNYGADFNNDGFVDILSGLTKQLYINNGDLTFTGQNVLVPGGGVGDFNADGFLDIIRGPYLLINRGNANKWLKINLRGIQSNKNGIGARIEMYGQWGKQIREVRSGQSYSPMSSLTTHFGLGNADSINKVVVKWPSGVVTVINAPQVNSTLFIEEEQCILPPFQITYNGNGNLCPNDTAFLVADHPGHIFWSNGQFGPIDTIINPGRYSATVIDSFGCLAYSDTIKIAELTFQGPVIADTTIGVGDSILLFATGENLYWFDQVAGGTLLDTGAYFQTPPLYLQTIYYVESHFEDLITHKICVSARVAVHVNIILSATDDTYFSSHFLVAPNPISEEFELLQKGYSPWSKLSVNVVNVLGEISVQKIFYPGQPLRINLEHLPSGIYTLLVQIDKSVVDKSLIVKID